MKSVFLITVVLAFSVTNLQAKLSARQETQTALQLIPRLSAQDEKVKIKKEELPEPARKTLEGDAFKGWAFANAYKLKNGEFEVELKKEEAAQVVKFDKEGKVK